MKVHLARITSLAGVALLAAGCAVGPKYERPETALTPAFVGTNALSQRVTQASAPGLDQWWLGFQDPVLTSIVQRALDENLDLAGAMARVDQARAAAMGAGAARLPRGSLDGQLLHQRQSLKSPRVSWPVHFPATSVTRPSRPWVSEPAGRPTWPEA